MRSIASVTWHSGLSYVVLQLLGALEPQTTPIKIFKLRGVDASWATHRACSCLGFPRQCMRTVQDYHWNPFQMTATPSELAQTPLAAMMQPQLPPLSAAAAAASAASHGSGQGGRETAVDSRRPRSSNICQVSDASFSSSCKLALSGLSDVATRTP